MLGDVEADLIEIHLPLCLIIDTKCYLDDQSTNWEEQHLIT